MSPYMKYLPVYLDLASKPLTSIPQVLVSVAHISFLSTANPGDRRLDTIANMADSAVYRALRLYVLLFTGDFSSVFPRYL